MSQQSNIEWTDATWNPVRGCTKVSPGCANCYAETFAKRFRGVKGHPYEQGFDLRLVPEKLTEPLSWKKPRRVFVNSMSDLFQDGVSDNFIDQVFAVMACSPRHTFQLLTKRPARMLAWATQGFEFQRIHEAAKALLGYHHPQRRALNAYDWPLSNVWLGVSVENQHFADERIPLLLQTPAAVRFISAEPLLEAINLHFPSRRDVPHAELDWVIVGGESGHGARPFDSAWARSIVDQCRSAGVACFVKQLGSNAQVMGRNFVGYRLRDKKGGDPAEWPADLRVRQFPPGVTQDASV